jgi:hypothetical protein
MIRILSKNWLLVLAGVLQATFAGVNLVLQNPDGSVALRKLAVESTILFQAKFALAAGACTVAAGVWSATRGRKGDTRLLESGLLMLNGVALCAYALIPIFWTGPLHLRPFFALLLVAMAMSAGILALSAARTRRGHSAEGRLLRVGGAVLVCFALAFFAIDFQWIKLEQPGSYFVWMSCFFALSAVCMLGLASRLNGSRRPVQGVAGSALPTG